jgi:hypothetical protein
MVVRIPLEDVILVRPQAPQHFFASFISACGSNSEEVPEKFTTKGL